MKYKYMYKVCVTKKDIEKGSKQLHSRCPVARALIRRFPYAFFASVHLNGLFVRLNSGDILLTYDDNHKIAKFVKDYDAGKPVKPFSFKIESTHEII